MKNKLNTKGSTLVISLIILSVLLTVGMIVSNIIVRDISLDRNFSNGEQAYFAAESGLKRSLWLIKNDIFSNSDADIFQGINFIPYVDSVIDMCPDFWDKDSNCPCPISPYGEACNSFNDKNLILSGELSDDGYTYDVYIKINYADDSEDNFNRMVYIISVGKFRNVEKTLEYSMCLGENCL